MIDPKGLEAAVLDTVSRADVLRICKELGDIELDYILERLPENARTRAAAEAMSARLRIAVALMPPSPQQAREPVAVKGGLLISHFRTMQSMAAAYVEPATYVDREGKLYPEPDNNHPDNIKQELRNKRARAFAADMIYMLDGPEERSAIEAALATQGGGDDA